MPRFITRDEELCPDAVQDKMLSAYGALNRDLGQGNFRCASCALPLSSPSTRFESGTGWPSFTRALPGSVTTRADHSLLMERTEVLCSRCGGHPGHVFPDGPKPTGLVFA